MRSEDVRTMLVLEPRYHQRHTDIGFCLDRADDLKDALALATARGVSFVIRRGPVPRDVSFDRSFDEFGPLLVETIKCIFPSEFAGTANS